MENILQNPIKTLEKLKTDEIVNILEKADHHFFNTNKPLLPDDIYDIVKQFLRKKDTKNKYLKKIGSDIFIKNKEELPFYMGSMDKIKDNTNEINKFKSKFIGDYIISEKLDGVSCLLICNKNINSECVFKLMTRGNGYIGQNITNLLKYININISNIKNDIVIRGELIITKENWNKDFGSNARNVVSGIVNSKTINKIIASKIDFVGYDILNPREKQSESLNILKNLEIKHVKFQTLNTDTLTLENLSSILKQYRTDSFYEIDGIVICHDYIHPLESGKNPIYAFAFKSILTQEQAEVIVSDIEWNVSKQRLLKPIIKFNEVNLSGVSIKQTTGFNAAYIEKNCIGIGSHIVIIRSGDVIPHILSVLSPSSNGKPKFPEIPYIWNDTKIDILLNDDIKNKEHDLKAFEHFMNAMDIEGVKIGVITKIYNNGYDTLYKILNIKLDELKKIEGLGIKSSEKIIDEFKKIHNVDCYKLLYASNLFKGFGKSKFQLIINEYPYIGYDKEKSLKLKIDDIVKIKGIAKITAKIFIDNLPKYLDFSEQLGIKCKNPDDYIVKTSNAIVNNIFTDKKVLFSGFRDKKYEKYIIDSGGSIGLSISKSINYLIVKDKDKLSSKMKEAIELNINIITKEEFEKIIK